MEKKFWQGLLLIGIVMHLMAAMLMPLGLDAHVHASYVSDGMDDGEADLEWGETRPDSPDKSIPKEVPADDKWFAWHLVIEIWFTIFSPSINSLHILGLVSGLGCLAAIFFFTRDLFGQEQALRLTALASIYPPLIRAAGRFYQEGVIAMLVVFATYSIIKALRDKNNLSYWWIIPILCSLIILSFKGTPLWYAIPAAGGLVLANRLQMNQIHIAFFAILVELVVLYRNGVELSNPDIIPALLSAFIGCFIFVYLGMMLFTKKDGSETEESRTISRGSKMIMGCIVGWIAALWVTEAISLDRDFFDIVRSFRHNPRYLSLLIVPLWYSRMLRKGSAGLSIKNNSKILVSMICLMLLVNVAVLSATGERGTEVVGSHLGEEVEDGEDVLFLANSPLSMHRLYSVKFAMDPDSDGDNLGFWRHKDSGWEDELSQCTDLMNVNWIIVYPFIDPIIPEGWIEVEFEGSERVSENYHLYTWGEQYERCT